MAAPYIGHRKRTNPVTSHAVVLQDGGAPYWPSERTNPVTSHAVVLQDGGALAPNAITKPFFFKINHVYIFSLKRKSFLNKVNLTDFYFKVPFITLGIII